MKTNRPIGIYLHVPFCRQKCLYCDFYSFPPCAQTIEEYIRGIHLEVEKTPKVPADTLYIGGGTPTLFPLQELEKLLILFKTHFAFSSKAEITIEANPESVSPDTLQAYHKMGINRISFGVQSMQDRELRALGRTHCAKQAVKAIRMAREAGFSNLSADLMLGVPYQTQASLADTLEKVGALPLTHLSIYLLKLEPGTPLHQSPLRHNCASDDQMAALYLDAVSWAENHGFKQYEISNFAKEGYACKHNLKYWTLQEYLGFGPAAYSYYRGIRYGHSRNLKSYACDPSHDQNDLDTEAGSAQERWMLGLRLKKGVPEKDLPDRSFLTPLLNHGLIIRKEDRIAFTPKGMLLSNAIYPKLGYQA